MKTAGYILILAVVGGSSFMLGRFTAPKFSILPFRAVGPQ